MDGIIQTALPHSAFGDPDCCGCLNAIIHGASGQADIVCNECGLIVRRVPASDLQLLLDGMELELDVATAICPHCRAVHLAPGFTKLYAFVCDQCGAAVQLADPRLEK
jgi:ribosomal protein S27E